jgi:hypothetical protein
MQSRVEKFDRTVEGGHNVRIGAVPIENVAFAVKLDNVVRDFLAR